MSNDADALVEALTDDEYEYVPVDELHEHPKNEEVYGENDPGESFVDDIRRNGRSDAAQTPTTYGND